jgi:hypothetical protein
MSFFYPKANQNKGLIPLVIPLKARLRQVKVLRLVILRRIEANEAIKNCLPLPQNDIS